MLYVWRFLFVSVEIDVKSEEVATVVLLVVVESAVNAFHHLIDGIRLVFRGQCPFPVVVTTLAHPCRYLVFQAQGDLWGELLSKSHHLYGDGVLEIVALGEFRVVVDIGDFVLRG